MSMPARQGKLGKLTMVGSSAETISSVRVAALRRVFPDHQRVARGILEKLTQSDCQDRARVTGPGFLVCITPRSGSSLLCDVLGKTGSVGFAREHFPSSLDAPL